jgi:hypothetical protein
MYLRFFTAQPQNGWAAKNWGVRGAMPLANKFLRGFAAQKLAKKSSERLCLPEPLLQRVNANN